MDDPAFYTLTALDRPDLPRLADEIVPWSWPPYMLENPQSRQAWPRLYAEFPAFQYGLFDSGGRLAGIGNCLPIRYKGTLENLPDNGWEWALAQGFADAQAGRTPTHAVGLSITLRADLKGGGLSAAMVRGMVQVVRAQGIPTLLIALRPTQKVQYPLIPMQRYIQWQREDGQPFDPWIRVHLRMGARLIKACTRALSIPGTLAQWEQWTGLHFPGTGDYIIPGALAPLYIDREAGTGLYVEPKVWIAHEGNHD